MKKFKITNFDTPRGADELIVYTQGERTKTNAYGIEAVVVDGRVAVYGSNNNFIPAGAFVVSGHGAAALFIKEEITLGCKVSINDGFIEVEKDERSKMLECDVLRKEILERFEVRKAAEPNLDTSEIEMLLERSVVLAQEERFDEAKDVLEELFYLTALSKENEVRAVWHRPLEKSVEEVEATVRKFKELGFNIMLVETNYGGYANARKCERDILPIRREFADTDFDVIEEFIRAGKKYGVEMHAWVEDFFFGVEGHGCKIMELHPELIARTKDGGHLVDAYKTFIFLNPASEAVHELLVELYRDLLDKYDFDGIQLDYIRYPVINSVDNSAGFEPETIAEFLADTGIDVRTIESTSSEEWAKFNRWRADKVTSYVKRIVELVGEYKAKGRDILLSTAVFGDPVDAINKKCQDWLFWTKQGWLDFISPMAYLNDAKDVGREVAHMVENYGEVPNVAGIAPMYNHLPVIESTKQVEECRKAGAVGVAFFAAASFTEVQIDKLKKGVFRK